MKRALQESRTKIPRGMATHLPEGASLRRYVQETLLSTFFRWGYREVVTPVFEYLDILSAGLSSGLLEKSYKFVDRESGKLMLLRPDITPQVARMVAGILSDEPKPLRLCYYGNIFRHEESHAGREREMTQVGCELVGIASPDADAEIIAVTAEAIQRLGIENFKIVIGQVGYLNGILSFLRHSSGLVISPDNEDALQEAIGRKDVELIEHVLDLAGIEDGIKKNILQIPHLFGGEEIFDKAASISDNQESSAAIENLRQTYYLLSLYGLKDHILIDLCDIRGIDYYTGLFFEIFSPGITHPLGRGGRYDNLIGRFGYDCPSTGFAIDMESIIMAKERQGEFFTDRCVNYYLVIGQGKDNREAIELVRKLREAGSMVVMGTGLEGIDESVKYAGKSNIEKVIVIDVISGEVQFSMIDVKTGRKARAKRVEDLMPAKQKGA